VMIRDLARMGCRALKSARIESRERWKLISKLYLRKNLANMLLIQKS
jgi:hypothetical protein